MSDESDGAARVELEADNRRLRRLLDQRDAPGELRHRLRGMVATLRTIIRKSAETTRDLDDYAAHLEDRLDALARAQACADEHGTVDLHQLIADELFHYNGSEGERVVLSGPEVHFPPRAGQVLALAVHELAVNSVEHGALGTGKGHIEITWTVSERNPGQTLTLAWKELGNTGMSQPSHQGFGTEVLTRTLRYELKADTLLVYEPTGLNCTISFPLPEPARGTGGTSAVAAPHAGP